MGQDEVVEAGTVENEVSGRFRYVCIGLALIPLLALLYKTWHYGLAFPYWDEWEFAHLLDKSRQVGDLLLQCLALLVDRSEAIMRKGRHRRQ